MKRYTITELVHIQVLGFLRDKHEEFQRFELEEVRSITHFIRGDDKRAKIMLKSEHLETTVFEDLYLPCVRAFKTPHVFLANLKEEVLVRAEDVSEFPPCVMFGLGRGYFAILTALRKKEAED